MHVKEAVAAAKAYAADLFASEKIENLGLEEVTFDQESGEWSITVGFSRPWDAPNGLTALVRDPRRRTYKTVVIRDETGEVQGVKHFEVSV